jgi:transcriptional regulator with XRE-family HTH domain
MSYDLALIRTKAGLKQHELAEKLGWSQAQISRYESSPKSITIAQAELWIEACGMTEESARD